jgi:heme-degrading monooxygenase HmoA
LGANNKILVYAVTKEQEQKYAERFERRIRAMHSSVL